MTLLMSKIFALWLGLGVIYLCIDLLLTYGLNPERNVREDYPTFSKFLSHCILEAIIWPFILLGLVD